MQTIKMSKRGFTLIELLVVITIIGILASVVLISFPGATAKARDSRIVSAISQARTVMTYIAANDTNYGNLQCDNTTCACSNTELDALCREIKANVAGNNPLSFGFVRNVSPYSEGCIWANLNAVGNQDYYCADSATGAAGYATTSPTGGGYCVNGTTARCPAVTS